VDELADDLESEVKYIFMKEWDSINKKYPSGMNPWVIDYGYKLLEVNK